MAPKPQTFQPPSEASSPPPSAVPNPELVRHIASQLIVFARRVDAIEQRLQAELHDAAQTGDVARVKTVAADWQRLRDASGGSK